jgi:hypothetical protein
MAISQSLQMRDDRQCPVFVCAQAGILMKREHLPRSGKCALIYRFPIRSSVGEHGGQARGEEQAFDYGDVL